MTIRTLLLATGLAPALFLGACGTVNRGLESVHQPVVSRTDYALDVATSGDHLAPGESQRLTGWMASMRLGYGDRVAIDNPNPTAGVRDDIAHQVSQYGLLVAEEAPLTDAPVTPGMVRVVLSRTTATVPHCPDFTRTSASEFNSNTSSNQGCAVNSNLAAMVANPADLVRGEIASGVTDQRVSSKAVGTYRSAPNTGAAGVKSDSAGGK